MGKSDPLLGIIAVHWLGLLLDVASLPYRIDESQGHGQHSRIGIARLLGTAERFYGSDSVLTKVDIRSRKGKIFSNDPQNQFYDGETNITTNMTRDHLLELKDEEHDLILSTGSDKNCIYQSTESSDIFVIYIPELVKIRGIENARDVGVEYDNSDSSKTRKNIVVWPMRSEVVDYNIGKSSDYMETRKKLRLRDYGGNCGTKKLDSNKDESNDTPLPSILQKIVSGRRILEVSAIANVEEHQDGTVVIPAITPIERSRSVLEDGEIERKLQRKLDITNSNNIEGGIDYKDRFKDTGKRGQAKTFPDINENSRVKEIWRDSNIRNLVEKAMKNHDRDIYREKQAENISLFQHKQEKGNGNILKNSPANFDRNLPNYYYSGSISVLSKSDVVINNIKGIQEVLPPIYVKDRRARRGKRSNAGVATRSEDLVNMHAKDMKSKRPGRLFKNKIRHDVDTFGRRTAWTIDKGAKTKGTRLDSLNKHRMPAFNSYNGIGERENISPRKIAAYVDYRRKLNGNDLNNLFDRMDMLAQHIDKLHERYLRYNELNDDYISKELPQEYFDQ